MTIHPCISSQSCLPPPGIFLPAPLPGRQVHGAPDGEPDAVQRRPGALPVWVHPEAGRAHLQQALAHRQPPQGLPGSGWVLRRYAYTTAQVCFSLRYMASFSRGLYPKQSEAESNQHSIEIGAAAKKLLCCTTSFKGEFSHQGPGPWPQSLVPLTSVNIVYRTRVHLKRWSRVRFMCTCVRFTSGGQAAVPKQESSTHYQCERWVEGGGGGGNHTRAWYETIVPNVKTPTQRNNWQLQLKCRAAIGTKMMYYVTSLVICRWITLHCITLH